MKLVSSVENVPNKKASSDAFFVSAFSTRGHVSPEYELLTLGFMDWFV